MQGSSTPPPSPEATEIGQLDAELHGLARGAGRHCPDIREFARNYRLSS